MPVPLLLSRSLLPLPPCTQALLLLLFSLKDPRVPHIGETAGVHTCPALSCLFSLHSKFLCLLHPICCPLPHASSLPLLELELQVNGAPCGPTGCPHREPPSFLTRPGPSHPPQPQRDLWVFRDGRRRPAWGVRLGPYGPWGSWLGLTWGWKSSGDGRRYFSFRAPTGSVTFRFSTLLDSNTEGYGPHRAAQRWAGRACGPRPSGRPPVPRQSRAGGPPQRPSCPT